MTINYNFITYKFTIKLSRILIQTYHTMQYFRISRHTFKLGFNNNDKSPNLCPKIIIYVSMRYR